MQQEISKETEAVLLLCGHFAPKEQSSPLELRELNRLVDVLEANARKLSDLLDADPLDEGDWLVTKLDRDRVMRLVGRGAAMAIAVERWTSGGLWIVARGEHGYPERLTRHLGRSAPPLLFGVGDAEQLERGGFAIVGSRDVDEAGRQFTEELARQCARENVTVVSGGARGVDEIALTSAFDEGGSVVAILPEGLGKASVAASYRSAIREERLVLLSPYAPHAPFSVGNAMGRNRLIYALADAALVVASAAGSGGTWAGAKQELERERGRRVYVRTAAPPIDGNEALLKIGGVAFPEEALRGGIGDLLLMESKEPEANLRIADAVLVDDAKFAIETTEITTPDPEHTDVVSPRTAYDAILPLLIELLEKPATAKEIAAILDVAPPQAKKWLDRAVAEKRITKSGRPAKFRKTAEPSQPSLFG